MPIKHLTRRTGGHLQKDPITGHLALSCHDTTGHPCTIACALDPDPHCCDTSEGSDPTPNKYHLTILAAAASVNCSYDTAPNYHVHRLDASGLAGHTFELDYDSDCRYSGEFDVTSMVKLLQCIGDGSGCGACTPSADITDFSTMRVSYIIGGTVDIDFIVKGTDTELDTSTDGFPVSGSSLTPSASPPDTCCSGWTGSAPALTGTELMEAIAVTSIGMVPC